MLSLLRSRCSGSFCSVYRANVKYAHRSSGGRQRRHQHLSFGQGQEDRGNETVEDAEEIEDFHNWFEANVAKPEFQKAVASEEEKLKKKIMHKMIERKYYKKPQEMSLLTWDAREQIRFLNNEYPNEWTVDRLAESFPTSREGVIKILKSKFQPKSLAEIVNHDERVQKRWKELEDGKKKGVAAGGGPVSSRYQGMLKSAAGNPSLPMPELNRLLLSSGSGKRATLETGTFLSIVKDYCDKEQGMTDASVVKHVKSKKSDQLNLLEDHIAMNRKLIEGVVEMSPDYLGRDRKPIKSMVDQSPNHFNQTRKQIKGTVDQSSNDLRENRKQVKSMVDQSPNHFNQTRKQIKGTVEQSSNDLHENRKQVKSMVEQSPNRFNQNRKPIRGLAEQSPKYSERKYTDLYKTLESEKHSTNGHFSKGAGQDLNKEMRPKQLIDSDFGVSLPDKKENLVSVMPQSRVHSLRRRSVGVSEETDRVEYNKADEALQGTMKLGVSKNILQKMEANSRLALEVDQSGSRHVVDRRSKEVLQSMKDEDVEEGTETYMFSEEKGYQRPFGQRKDLPVKRIPVPRNQLKSGVEFRTGNDFYDEDGEFLYRKP